jgi:hypothetical protein
MIEKIKSFFTRYERYVSPATVVIGFIFDNLTLRRIDVFFSNALLISYLIISALSIMLLNIRESRRTRAEAEHADTIHMILIFMMQFCLGGLFSASFLFYSKSGTLIASWPFLLMLVGYVVGNEILRKNYVRLGFQIAVFFTALFSYLIFFLPIILGKMGDPIFILSGIASLMLTGLFIYILSWFAPARTAKSAPIVMLSLAGVFALMNALYFTNVIPPIPLSFKEAGIYRSVEKLPDGTYLATGEKQSWFRILASDPILHMVPGQPLYALTSIFAPTNLKTNVIHSWQYYDDKDGGWVVANTVSLAISGGREGGFRTYSVKENVFPGLWRVDVTTPRGQLIGRLTFKLEPSRGNEKLEREVK